MRPAVSTLLIGLLAFFLARWSTSSPLAEAIAPAVIIAPRHPRAPSAAAPDGPRAEAIPPTPSSLPLVDQITFNFRPAHPFESAVRVIALIDAMTVEDFQKLVAGARLPVPWVYGMDRDFAAAFLESLVDRWLAANPSEALAQIRALEAKLKKGSQAGAGEVLSALTRVRPTLLLDAFFDKSEPLERGTIDAAFTALAARDLPSARAYLARFGDRPWKREAEVAIAHGIAKTDPIGGIALAREYGNYSIFRIALAEAERIGPGVLRQVLHANDGYFQLGTSLPELILRYPDEDWKTLVPSVKPGTLEKGERPPSISGLTMEMIAESNRLTPAARDRLIEQLDQIPAASRAAVAGAVARNWAMENPREATLWAFSRALPDYPNSLEVGPLMRGFHQWLKVETQDASVWWSALPPSPLRAELGNAIASHAAGMGHLDRAIAHFTPSKGLHSAPALSAITAAGDPARVANWLATLPAEIDTGAPVQTMLAKWIKVDPAAAAGWVESLPPGPRRDAALGGYALSVADTDPLAAGEWAASIADPAARVTAAEFIYSAIRKRDPPAARVWLQSFQGIDESMRERLIRLR